MVDDDLPGKPTPSQPAIPAAEPPHRAGRWRLALLVAGLVLLVGGAAFAAWWYNSPRPDAGPLDGRLVVTVRPPERAVEPLLVEEPGALPVRAGGIMSLEIRLSQPAFAYLVWLDTEGRAVPLYPWNHETLVVMDVNQPPPVRRSATIVYSPPIGSGWKFGQRGGLETVLLLARRTPLDEGTQLGSLLGPLPPPAKVRARDELVVLGLDRGADSAG
jgi:hypothetical protein